MQKILIVLIFGIMISCKSQGSKKLTPEQKAIVEKLKENFVFVEGGDFIMGTNDIGDSSPEHKVTLSSFSMSKYETTYKEVDVYSKMIGEDLICGFSRNHRIYKDMVYGENRGVNCATWYQASGYCKWLGKQLNLPLDLATEAQWEYAARSRGRDVEHATNNDKIHPSIQEPVAKRNYVSVPEMRVDVGGYPPNPLGLYEMSGGAQEWTLDYAIGRYYRQHQFDPVQDSMHYGANLKAIRGYHS